MSAAREEILRRIRGALGDGLDPGAAAETEAPLATMAPASRFDVATRFLERVRAYHAEVVRAPDAAGDVRAAVGDACARHGARRLIVPDGLPGGWLPADADILLERSGTPLDLDIVLGADGVVTTCAQAIAETGTIVLDAGPGQGRRMLTLLPDLHICVVPIAAIVPDVPDAIVTLGDRVREDRRPVTLVSGPSATSDIELKRVEGVHGPRRLVVIVAG